MGKGKMKEESVRREEWIRRGLFQSEFLLLSNFMVAKGLFLCEYEMSVLGWILLSDDED